MKNNLNPFKKPGLGLLLTGLVLSGLSAGYAVLFVSLFNRPDGQTDSVLIPCGMFIFGLILALTGLVRMIRTRRG